MGEIFKFTVGRKVRVEGKQAIGTIVEVNYKQAKDSITGEIKTNKRYYVQTAPYVKDWYDEEQVSYAMDDMDYIDPDNIPRINDVLINASLINRNFDLVKDILNEKK